MLHGIHVFLLLFAAAAAAAAVLSTTTTTTTVHYSAGTVDRIMSVGTLYNRWMCVCMCGWPGPVVSRGWWCWWQTSPSWLQWRWAALRRSSCRRCTPVGVGACRRNCSIVGRRDRAWTDQLEPTIRTVSDKHPSALHTGSLSLSLSLSLSRCLLTVTRVDDSYRRHVQPRQHITISITQWCGLRPSVLRQDRLRPKNRPWSWSCMSGVVLWNTVLLRSSS